MLQKTLRAAVVAWPAAVVALAAAAATAAEPVLVEQKGHSLSVDAVAFSADSRLAATGGKDGTAILWDAAGGHTLRVIPAEPLGVVDLALSADGKRLATAGAGTASLWDAETGRLLRRVGRPGEFLNGVLLAPDGKTLVAVGPDGAARFWDAATGKLAREVTIEAAHASAAALSPDGTRLAVSAPDGQVWLFDARTSAPLKTLSASGPTARLAFSADGKRLAAGGEESVAVWDLPSGELRASFKAPASRGLAFAPDGERLFTCGGGSTARLWTPQGEPVRSFIGHADAVRALKLSADGRRLLTGSDDRSARVWDAETGRELRRLSGAPSPALEALVSADGRRLVVVDAGTARLWDLASGEPVRVTTGDFSSAASYSLTADGRLLADVRDREFVDLRDLETGQDLGTFQWNLLRAQSAALSSDGAVVATTNENRLQLWDRKTMRELAGAPPDSSKVNRFWLALGGKRLLYLDGFGSLHLWEPARAKARADWPARGAAPPDVALSPDGGFAATGEPAGGRQALSVRAMDDGALRAAWDDEPGASPFALSPGGRRLLVRGRDGVADWDVAARRQTAAWKTPRGAELPWPPAVEPGWRWLAASLDGGVLFLSLTDGRELARLSLTERGWVARAPDGRLDGSDGALRWTVGLSSYPLDKFPGARRQRGLLGALLGR